MKARLGLFNTNQVNLAGFAFPIDALERYLDQTWESGLPMFLSHDMHQPIGWTSTLGLLLCPEIVGVVGRAHIAESAEDMSRVHNAVRGYLANKYSEVLPEEEARLRSRIGVGEDEEIEILRRESVCAIGNGLASRLFPHLFAREEDKYALTDLRELHQVAPGVFEVNGLLLFAHQHFRRAQSRHNNLNAEFLVLLGDLKSHEDLRIKIALDPDMVGLPDTWKQYIELAHWWGPKFKDDLPAIDNGIARHAGNERMRLYHGIRGTDFWWHSQNDIKSFEVEEVRDAPSLGLSADHYACRYVHSMLHRTTNIPDHLDGAVRIYDTEKILERVDQNIATAGRHTTYIKLWRVDGPIPLSRWKELICHYYRDNQLVGEYFGGEDTVRIKSDEVTENGPRKLAAYLSRCLEASDGVLALVSYHPKSEAPAAPNVEIDPWDQYKLEDHTEQVIEFSAFDFIKLLRKQHSELTLPRTYRLFAIEDMDINLPLVVHRGADAAAHAARSLESFGEFIGKLNARSQDRFVTADFGIEYSDRLVKYAFAGRLASLAVLVPKLRPFPDSPEGIASWCDEAHAQLHQAFPDAKYRCDYLELVKPIGGIRSGRIEARLVTTTQEGADKLNVAMPKGDIELLDAVRHGHLTVAMWFDVHAANCSTCQTNYLECPCTVLLDEVGQVEPTEFDMMGCIWTTRPASDVKLPIAGA